MRYPPNALFASIEHDSASFPLIFFLPAFFVEIVYVVVYGSVYLTCARRPSRYLYGGAQVWIVTKGLPPWAETHVVGALDLNWSTHLPLRTNDTFVPSLVLPWYRVDLAAAGPAAASAATMTSAVAVRFIALSWIGMRVDPEHRARGHERETAVGCGADNGAL